MISREARRMGWLELQPHPFLHGIDGNKDGIFIQVVHVLPVVDTTAQPCTRSGIRIQLPSQGAPRGVEIFRFGFVISTVRDI